MGIFSLLWNLICGAVIGCIAAKLMGENTTFLKSAILGILGSFVGSLLSKTLHFDFFLPRIFPGIFYAKNKIRTV